MNVSRVHFQILFFLVLCAAACGADNDEPAITLPNRVGPVQLTETITGVAANKFVYRMHGKMIGSQSSAVGYYGAEAKNALYISLFENEDFAERALVRMAEKMSVPSMGFSPARAEGEGPAAVYLTEGMGLKHFFYRTGSFVVWWQAEPDIAQATYDALRGMSFGGR